MSLKLTKKTTLEQCLKLFQPNLTNFMGWFITIDETWIR